ncbi:MAG: alanine--glyoxylate aminotransferase family protein [Deltaproteobacteria bacterium]|jgi:aspartate aminotransferase-like enzyme|nr:alanine--glyoxylate aminotransferase family protein [Deltaproteobacteria bacterium]
MLDKMRLLTPGPTPLPERVRLALSKDMIHHRKAAFTSIMAEIQQKLQVLFGTSQEVLTLTASGTGAMVAAMQGLFAPGEKVLIISGGKFGERWTEIAQSHGIIPLVLKVPEGQGADPAEVKKSLLADAEIRGVFVQLCETSTGVQHPVAEIAAITSKTPVLLVVDGISGLGICPCPMDDWGLDVLLTGSQKGLMLPPGLALLALSERAWAKAGCITTANYYFNLLEERKNIKQNQTNFTPAIGLLLGLNESLNLFMEAGMENIFRKQWALCRMAQTGVEAMGLTLFAKKYPSWGVTSVTMPPQIKAAQVLDIAARNFNVLMAAGQGEYKNRLVRIGHMGWIDWADLSAGIHALAESCKSLGVEIACDNYLEQSLAAYWQTLEKGYPPL